MDLMGMGRLIGLLKKILSLLSRESGQLSESTRTIVSEDRGSRRLLSRARRRASQLESRLERSKARAERNRLRRARRNKRSKIMKESQKQTDRDLDFKEAVLVAVKVLSSFCFPHLQRESSIAAGELEMAVQRIHHLVTLEREPVLPEKSTTATPSENHSIQYEIGQQALSEVARLGLVRCLVNGCPMRATHTADGLPYCNDHVAPVAWALDGKLRFIAPLG